MYICECVYVVHVCTTLGCKNIWDNDSIESAPCFISSILSPQVVCMNVYDIALDFVLMDAFTDLANPPSTIVAALQNRWLTERMKEAVSSSLPLSLPLLSLSLSLSHTDTHTQHTDTHTHTHNTQTHTHNTQTHTDTHKILLVCFVYLWVSALPSPPPPPPPPPKKNK